MKNLILMRHGKSSWKDKELADFDRPLKKRGKRDTPLMGKLLRNEGFEPDIVISSPAVRCVETVDALFDSLKISEEMVEYNADFYHAEVDDYLEALSKLDDKVKSVLFVGHNPSLETLLQSLTGDIEALSTASAAWIKLSIEDWKQVNDEDLQGKLRDIWSPKQLRD